MASTNPRITGAKISLAARIAKMTIDIPAKSTTEASNDGVDDFVFIHDLRNWTLIYGTTTWMA